MKTKTENWLKIAQSDLGLAKQLSTDKSWRYYSPNFCHQAIEKLIKAVICERTTKIPPYIHKLKKLSQIAKLELTKDQIKFLLTLDPLYIGTKYPEEIEKIKQESTSQFVTEIYSKTHKLFICIKHNLK